MKNIKIYSSSTCTNCTAAKEYIKEKGYDDPILHCTSRYENIEQMIMLIVFTILILSIVTNLYWIVMDRFLYMELLFVLALGFATRMALSFSPTMFASSTRIYTYLYFSLIFISAVLVELFNLSVPFMPFLY